jgi:hypothetical protein
MSAHWPVRKSFELAIRLKGSWRRRSVHVVRYEEASVKDALEFDPKDPGEWAYRFVLERVRPLRGWEAQALWGRRFSLFQEISRTRFGVPDTDGKPGEWAPFASALAWMAKETGTPPHVLLAEYTFPQFRALSEGIAWNANAMTKEGKARNAALAARHKAEGLGTDEVALRAKLRRLEERNAAKDAASRKT